MERTLDDGVGVNHAATERSPDVRAGILEGVEATVEIPDQRDRLIQSGLLRRKHPDGAGGELFYCGDENQVRHTTRG